MTICYFRYRPGPLCSTDHIPGRLLSWLRLGLFHAPGAGCSLPPIFLKPIGRLPGPDVPSRYRLRYMGMVL